MARLPILLLGLIPLALTPIEHESRSLLQESDATLIELPARVTSFFRSESNIVAITQVDEKTYQISANRPGMCAVQFIVDSEIEVPDHAKKHGFIFFVSPNLHLTSQKTTFWKSGRL